MKVFTRCAVKNLLLVAAMLGLSCAGPRVQDVRQCWEDAEKSATKSSPGATLSIHWDGERCLARLEEPDLYTPYNQDAYGEVKLLDVYEHRYVKVCKTHRKPKETAEVPVDVTCTNSIDKAMRKTGKFWDQ